MTAEEPEVKNTDSIRETESVMKKEQAARDNTPGGTAVIDAALIQEGQDVKDAGEAPGEAPGSVSAETIAAASVREAITEAVPKETMVRTAVSDAIDEAVPKETIMSTAVSDAINEAVPKETITGTALRETITATALRETMTAVPAAGESADGEEDNGADKDAEGADDQEAEEKPVDPEIEEIKRKIIERKREKRRKARRQKTVFWTVLSIVFLTIAGFIFSLSGFFTVDSIEVYGNSHFTAEEIINIAHAVPGHNLLYSPDKTSIKDYLEQNPYIKSAEVSRKLPSTLVITVVERKQSLAFKYDDDYLIMDDEGILLKKTRTEPKLTMVKGLVVSRIRLGDTVGTEDQQMFSKLLKLIRATNAGDLYFVKIDMSSYKEDHQVKANILDKLVVKADYDALMTNIENGRLHKVVEELFDDGIKRGTIGFGVDGSVSFEPGI